MMRCAQTRTEILQGPGPSHCHVFALELWSLASVVNVRTRVYILDTLGKRPARAPGIAVGSPLLVNTRAHCFEIFV